MCKRSKTNTGKPPRKQECKGIRNSECRRSKTKTDEPVYAELLESKMRPKCTRSNANINDSIHPNPKTNRANPKRTELLGNTGESKCKGSEADGAESGRPKLCKGVLKSTTAKSKTNKVKFMLATPESGVSQMRWMGGMWRRIIVFWPLLTMIIHCYKEWYLPNLALSLEWLSDLKTFQWRAFYEPRDGDRWCSGVI